jgi:hypothetical protein
MPNREVKLAKRINSPSGMRYSLVALSCEWAGQAGRGIG